jgi:hypothetical protein
MEFVRQPLISYYVRGGPNQPLHRDPQWSIVLELATKLLTGLIGINFHFELK